MGYISRIKTWIAGEILYAADLNTEFNNCIDSQIPEPASVARGDLLFRGVSAWERLPAGTSGYTLQTKGSGANPEWVMRDVPIGSIVPYAGSSAPSGWLLCYGQAVSRTTYGDLFGVIGTTFGVGDGSTTFNVPDLRGRIPLGKDNMGGTSANRVTAAEADTIGGASGAETHTLVVSEMPAHGHDAYIKKGGAATFPALADGTDASSLNSGYVSIGNTGGDGAHNNVQPYITLNSIIKH